MGALKAGCQITRDLVLIRRLGAGGMATVWLAEHRRLCSEVVVKFLSEALVSDADARARFSREVTATLQVRSPHVVQVFDHGISDGGIPFIVMEVLEGSDLSKTMKQGQLRPDEVQHVIDGVAAALTKAHERGIVHRDIKPANVFMCSGGPRPFVKLVDFGIAKRLEDETMTATHALLGTPAYMSPEQLGTNDEIDHRTDLWALGVLTFHMLAGKPPFRGAHIANIAHAVLNEDTPRLTTLRPDLPPALDAFVFRALSRDPAGRFDSAKELADALAEALGDLAHSSTRKFPRISEQTLPLALATPSAPHAPAQAPARAAPSGPASTATVRQGPPRFVAPALGALPAQAPAPPPVVRSSPSLPPLDSVGATFGPSSITHTPYAAKGKLTWWALGTAVVGLVAVGGAVLVGYGLRHEHALRGRPPAAAAVEAPPVEPEPAPPPPPVNTAGTVIGASSAPWPSATSPAPRAPSTATTPRKLPTSRLPIKGGGHSDDDVGF